MRKPKRRGNNNNKKDVVYSEIVGMAEKIYGIKLNKSSKNSLCSRYNKLNNDDFIQDEFNVSFTTPLGCSIIGPSDSLLKESLSSKLKGKVQLVLTSPPFPLNRQKKYGNFKSDKYIEWLKSYSSLLRDILTPDGSIVIEIGNTWEPGLPVMSTLPMEALLEFKKASDLYLCQEFIWYNPAKLPTPSYWVSIKRSRVKDAFTRLWWLSPTPDPKASNRNVLVPYSLAMKRLLKSKKYNHGIRPSEHKISPTSFLGDNGGAIPPNVLFQDVEPENMIITSNTKISSSYKEYCKGNIIPIHPARMPIDLAKFFINLCTDPGDIVFDPFGGSNTTGAAAEELGRRWVTIELNKSYADSGKGRFENAINGSNREVKLADGGVALPR